MADADIGIWKLTDGEPEFFGRRTVNLEKQLEDWLERDGNLIQAGLHIVGRQVRTPVGILDLLALDSLGRWSVIEIKRGDVRRDTMIQALDYASYLADMPADELRRAVTSYLERRHVPLRALLERLQLDDTIFNEPRDIQVFVVGTRRDESFDRLAKHVHFHDTPINAVTFSVYENGDGERLLMRELNELDTPQAFLPQQTASAEQPLAAPLPDQLVALFAQADHYGYGDAFRTIYEAATGVGLYPRLYAKSIMYAPMTNKTRFLLFTAVKPNRQRLLRLSINVAAFSEFYPVTESEVMKYLDGEQHVDLAGAKIFAQQLKKLFDRIDRKAL